MSYSIDLKKRAVRFFQNNHTFEETQEAFGMARSTLYAWIEEAKGDFPEKPRRTCEKKIKKTALVQALKEKPDSELSELAAPFGCSEQAVFYALKRLGITRKKRRSLTPKSPGKPGRSSL